MTFCNKWEKQYANGNHMSIWPWSDLVSYMMRYTKIKEKKLKILEMGCGAGANIPFFAKMAVDYYAIEGSKSVVQFLHGLEEKIVKRMIPEEFTFASWNFVARK